MARIELRDATIYIQDGLSGNAVIAEATPGAADTDCDINTVLLPNSAVTTLVPIGARFTVNTANNTTIYTVDGRYGVNETQNVSLNDTETTGNFTLTYENADGDTDETANIAWNAANAAVQTALEALTTIGTNNVAVTGGPGPTTDWVVEFLGDEGSQDCVLMTGNGSDLTGGNGVVTITETLKGGISPSTNIEFAPAWGLVGLPSQADIITFIPQRIDVKVGEGNITWTEAKEYEYLLDRGDLDTVKEGDEQPLEVSLEFVYEHITTGTNEDITPVDALKQTGSAAEWVSSSDDLCEPYAIDMIILHCVPCGTDQDEQIAFTDFRYESLEFDLAEATIAVSGRCNISEVSASRSTFTDCE